MMSAELVGGAGAGVSVQSQPVCPACQPDPVSGDRAVLVLAVCVDQGR